MICNDKPVPRQNQRPVNRTNSGRVTRKPQRYDTELGNIGLNQSEVNYFASMIDVYILDMDGNEAASHATVINGERACVGAGI